MCAALDPSKVWVGHPVGVSVRDQSYQNTTHRLRFPFDSQRRSERMDCKIGKLATLGAVALLLVGLVAPASAQVFVGRIDVTIEDSTGGRLPGVSVTLAGPSPQTATTDDQGRAHFLNLPVGTYTVEASLSGFNPYSNRRVDVAAGAAVDLPIRLTVAGAAESIQVTAATPLIDTRRETTTTHVTLEELQNVPTARDP